MLTVRRCQFEELAFAMLALNVTAEIRDQFAEFVAPSQLDKVSELARKALAEGTQRGLTWESTLGSFVILSLVLGPEFMDRDAIQRQLDQYLGSLDEKFDLMIRNADSSLGIPGDDPDAG